MKPLWLHQRGVGIKIGKKFKAEIQRNSLLLTGAGMGSGDKMLPPPGVAPVIQNPGGIMYQFKENVDKGQFFWWEKKYIKNMNWALLPKSSQAVFPVIACHANMKGKAFPGEQTIAILAGISDKMVRGGIAGLRAFSNFSFSYYITQRGKRAKRFLLDLPLRNDNGKSFPFYKFIQEAGIWRSLLPSAKALYPVIRTFSYFDINLYAELEGLEIDQNDFEEIYSNREYDFLEAELGVMAEHAGMHRNSINAALKNLEQNFLIAPLIKFRSWKVYVKSKDLTIWNRDYLNRKVLASYKHILQCTKTTGDGLQKLPKNAQKVSKD